MFITQSYLTLWDPMNCSQPGSSVHGIFQARIVEWVAIPFYRGSSPLRDQTQVFCIAGRFLTISYIAKMSEPEDAGECSKRDMRSSPVPRPESVVRHRIH